MFIPPADMRGYGVTMGGWPTGLRMPVQPPPFYYRSENTAAVSDRNQATQRPIAKQQDHNRDSRRPRRGIMRQPEAGRPKYPTQRRLVHFMPERFSPEEHKLSVTVSGQEGRRTVQVPSRAHSVEASRSKKTAEKAHRDTLRRRERRQRNQAMKTGENNTDFGLLRDNRFVLLSSSDEAETNKEIEQGHPEAQVHAMETEQGDMSRQTAQKQKVKHKSNKATTSQGSPRGKKTPGKNLHPTTFWEAAVELEMPTTATEERTKKSYLQGYKVLAYLKERVKSNSAVKFDLTNAFNEVSTFALQTVEVFDDWVLNNFEVQVWQKYYELGSNASHWAKEIVNSTHSRETAKNTAFCEKKIAYYTSLCCDANNILTRYTKDLESELSTIITNPKNVAKRTHDLLLDYIKEATQGFSKTCVNRIRRASLEKEEWDALQAFESSASEQQKIYAKTFCKPTLKSYQKKRKHLELAAAHVEHDIVPKILPRFDFTLPVDESSLSSDQAQANREQMHKLSRDFRLRAAELHLKIAREEFDFQQEKLDKLLHDLPHDSTDEDRQDDGEPRNEEDDVLTQRSQGKANAVSSRGSQLYAHYIEQANKRVSLEIEREVHFLVESGVDETPFEIKDTRDLYPVLRKDFTLLA